MKSYLLLLSLLLSFFNSAQVAATSLLPISLEQLSTRAELIFYATVTNHHVEKDTLSGRIATFTEFEIIELIKGNSDSSHTIKQLGGRLESDQTIVKVRGVPKYEMGKKYLVFLPKESKLGFCSPLGLHQGSFSVSTIDGEQIISNGHHLAQQSSRILSNGQSTSISAVQLPLAVSVNNPTQARLTDFINSVRAYNAQ